MNDIYVFVDFHKYCPKCKHVNVNEVHDPCNECLEHPANENSEKPVKFEERKERKHG